MQLCDGQKALWEACARHLPKKNSTSVLDILHVTPRLWQAAHVFQAEKSQEAEGFVRERLLRGEVSEVIRGLRQMGTKRGLKGSRKKALQTVCNYLRKNAERMRYDEYLSKGYPIASGVIEETCRHLMKDRMERAGMHWTPRGAMLNQEPLETRSSSGIGCHAFVLESMLWSTKAWHPNPRSRVDLGLDVRSVYVNGAWEEYQAYRIERETERLYPNRSLFTSLDFLLAV